VSYSRWYCHHNYVSASVPAFLFHQFSSLTSVIKNSSQFNLQGTWCPIRVKRTLKLSLQIFFHCGVRFLDKKNNSSNLTAILYQVVCPGRDLNNSFGTDLDWKPYKTAGGTNGFYVSIQQGSQSLIISRSMPGQPPLSYFTYSAPVDLLAHKLSWGDMETSTPYEGLPANCQTLNRSGFPENKIKHVKSRDQW